MSAIAVTSVSDLLKAAAAPGILAVPNDDNMWQSFEKLLDGLADDQVSMALREDGLLLFSFDTEADLQAFRKKIRPLRSYVYGEATDVLRIRRSR